MPGAGAEGDGPTAAQARAGQWWLGSLGVSKAHEVTQGSGVTVCVIDDQFDVTHPDLAGADFVKGADLWGRGVAVGGAASADSSHGTSTAALVVGQGSGPGRSGGILGVAPKARVVWVAIDFDASDGLYEGLKACADLGAGVVTASLGGTLVDPAAIAYAQARDVVIVAPTGNSGSRVEISDFASKWGVLAVTGVDASLTIDPRASTAGAVFPVRDIDPTPMSSDQAGTAIAGPYSRVGGTGACQGVPVAVVGGGYALRCGTSYAAPVVAGVVALVRSKFPELNAANVVNRVVATANRMGASVVPAPPLGFGVVDAYAAVSAQVPLVEHSPLGSCYTGGRGVWDERVTPTRPEPPVGTRLVPAPWKDPIADVPVAPRVTGGASSSGASSSGAASSGGVPSDDVKGVSVPTSWLIGGLALCGALVVVAGFAFFLALRSRRHRSGMPPA